MASEKLSMLLHDLASDRDNLYFGQLGRMAEILEAERDALHTALKASTEVLNRMLETDGGGWTYLGVRAQIAANEAALKKVSEV